MNRESAKDYLPLVQALAEGRVIEHHGSGGWYQLNNPTFQDPPSDYRIKPEPREIWVNRSHDGRHGAATYNSREEAARGIFEGWTPIRYREVIE